MRGSINDLYYCTTSRLLQYSVVSSSPSGKLPEAAVHHCSVALLKCKTSASSSEGYILQPLLQGKADGSLTGVGFHTDIMQLMINVGLAQGKLDDHDGVHHPAKR
jgi:hypothetical protein